MKMSSSVSTTLLVVAALGSHLVSVVSGHGYLARPLSVVLDVSIDKTSYSSTIDADKLFPGGTFNTHPLINIASFEENFKKSPYKSLKAMIMDNQVLVSEKADPVCGYTSPENTSYGALNDTIYWGRSEDITQGEGFVHDGPCETFCDDQRIQQDTNCMITYKVTTGAAPVPIDNTKCTNAKRLTFYWIAMHGAKWQVYISCVNINRGGGSLSSEGASTTTSAGSLDANPATIATPATPSASTTPATPPTSNSNPLPKVEPSPTPTTTPTTTSTPPEVSSPINTVGGEASTPGAKCSGRRVRD